MTLNRLARALIEPVSNAVMLPALVLFWVLAAIALAQWHWFAASDSGAGLLGTIGMTIIAVFLLPALVRYLLLVIEERACRRSLPLLDLGLFGVANSPRRLFALVPATALLALYIVLRPGAPLTATVTVFTLALVGMPLHAVLLALTDSPLQSINPLAMWRLLGRLLPAWLWLLPLGLLVVLSWQWLASHDTAGYWLTLLGLYWLIAFANVCGILAARIDVAAETVIPMSSTADDEKQARLSVLERQAALNHAYALLSRGNREGGFAHLDAHADNTSEPLLTQYDFFNAMLRWDLADVPLFYAQSLLPALLDAGQHAMAMKVLVQCLHRNERFRPRAEDVPRLRALAEQSRQQDVLRALAG